MASKKFVVTGPHRVHEINPGETIELDPTEPETLRLLGREQIAPAPSSRRRSAGEASTDDGPDTGSSEESEE